PGYTTVTGRDLDELLCVDLFDAFPDNPGVPEVQPTRRLAEAVEEVFRSGRVQHLPPMRYDIPDRRRRGRFVVKRWFISCTPVVDADGVIGAGVRGQDLTLVDDDIVEVLSRYRDLLACADPGTPLSRERLDTLHGYLELVESHARLAAEVTGLREALRSRPVIEQAKGMIMGERGCTADEAFAVLKQLSMDTNVRLADVAAAIVYQSRRGD
ncbi:MAG TPA: ANTAR domain-containing protein, partial [Marmoricola sp.]|nr:ANTAR domain-containing protein [Marmoricola sp.]